MRVIATIIGALALLILLIITISGIGTWLDYQTNGPRQQPIQTINTRHGDRFDLYDIDASGQPCLLLQHGETFSLTCDWTSK